MFMEEHRGAQEHDRQMGKRDLHGCRDWWRGLLLGLDGFMWKESVAVNRIAVSSVPWFLVVLLCILRWLYAPHQTKFIYLALFVFGVCFTTHQSLIVAGIGVQVAIAAGNMRLGRDVFFMDFVFYLIYCAYYWRSPASTCSPTSEPSRAYSCSST